VGLNSNPDLNARCERFLAGRPRPQHQYAKRTEAELTSDVNRLSDLLVELVRERDWLLVESESLKNWVRFLRYAVITEGCIIGWFATELFSRIK
jgi:hypothetical protein